MTSSSTMSKNKPLKWTTQRVNNIKSTPRVHKRTPSNTRNSTGANNIAAAIMTAEVKTDPTKEIESLLKEIEFSFDTYETFKVHLGSLQHAYQSCKPELDKTKSATRLGEMEKELLTAYDDLGLQAVHLERKIKKMEKRLSQLRELEAIYSPAVTTTTTEDLNFMSSPCSSTDSSVADYQLDSFYCNDWNLSQIISEPLLTSTTSFTQQGCDNNNDMLANTIPSDFYQQFYCDLNMYSNANEELYLSYPTFS